MFNHFFTFIDSILVRDPAARSRAFVILFYPGVHAVLFHRAANWLWRTKFFLFAMVVAQTARFVTGIEIHPGAAIGRNLFIDHGLGTVIGETTIIGNDVTIYHNVTLGGLPVDSGRRHPSIGDGAMLGAGSQILGPVTVGARAKVGANAVVVRDVPPGATAVGVPARIIQ
jgi:serine O-acetyltransferase